MPFRARVVASAAFLLVPTVAQASSHPVQVNGNKLKSALLPASAFGAGSSSVPGSGGLETTLQSMSKTKVGSYQAFQLTPSVNLSELPGFTLTLNTLVTIEGTDVFTVVSFSGTNDPVSSGLMLKLVNRVKKLR